MKETQSNKPQEEKIGVWANKTFYVLCAVCLLAIGFASYTAYRELTPTAPNDTASKTPSSTVSLIPTPKNEPTVSTEPIPAPSVKESATNAAPVADFFIQPMSGATIYKPFLDKELQYSNTYGDYRLHAAVDIVSDVSDTVTACGDGIVTEVKSDPLFGMTVTVDHGNGILASYSGLAESVAVVAGDTVSSTTVLGTIGLIPSESLDAAHLHLVFTKDGQIVSPLDYIR